jgi:hypothetical protein
LATGLEGALVTPVVDGMIGLFKVAKKAKLKSTAEKALGKAI